MTKTLSFAAVHFTIAFAVGYAFTGSLVAGGAVALLEPALNTLAFFFHEKAWQRLQARRVAGTATVAC
ncbi:MAG: DUF2061 domain-containing protein [Gammaproteobacteria bacterium]